MKKYNSFVLEQALYHTPGHVYWKNTRGVYLGCNYSNAKTLNLKSPADIIGKTDFDLVWKKNAKTFRKNDLFVLDTKKPEVMEEIALIGDKQLVYLSQKLPLINEKGTVVGIIGISIDITDQKQLETVEAEKVNIAKHVISSLTAREDEIVRFLVAGEKVKAISQKINISQKTVHSYRYRIFEKFGVKSDRELMAFIINYDIKALASQINPSFLKGD